MAFSVTAYVFLAIFCVSSVVHLVGCFRGSPPTAYTKPLLISSLTLFYSFAADPPSPVLIAALAASWLGDVLLMPSGNGWFVSGGISFLISHALFLAAYLPHIVWSAVVWWAVAPAALFYIAASAAVMRSIWKNTPGPMRLPMFLYLAANGCMNLFAFMLLLSVPCAGSALAFAGAALFFTSDCVLFLSRYHDKRDKIPKRGFIIMLTYIVGEALIAFGVMNIR